MVGTGNRGAVHLSLQSRWLGALGVIAALLIALSACTAASPTPSVTASGPAASAGGSDEASSEPTPEPEPDDVTLRLDFTINGKHAAFIVGIAQGFYEEHGINLSVEEGRGSLAGAQLVAAKDDLVAFVDATSMVTAAAEGAPLRMVACFQQQTPTAAISFEPIDSPEDLNGKIIGYSPVGSVPLAWAAFKVRNGLSADNFTEVTLDGPALLPALIDGRIDVDLGLINAEGAAAPVLSGRDVNILKFSEWRTNALAHGLVFHQDTIDENPDLVRRFVEASVQSWEYAIANPVEAIDALMEAYPEANREIIEAQLELSNGLVHTPNTEDQPIGFTAGEDWQATVDLLADYGGVVSDKPTSEYYTNEFLPE
jgi:NitT/TauT family transport system substrate-binding protein